jgi:hypothetical protein
MAQRRKTLSTRTLTRIAMRRAGAFSGPGSYNFAGGLFLLALIVIVAFAAALNSSPGLLFLLALGVLWLTMFGPK